MPVVFIIVLAASVVAGKIFGTDIVQGFFIASGLRDIGRARRPLIPSGLYLMSVRENIARWYYFTFFPHPAEPIIQSALSDGTVLDANQLATILGGDAARGRILRAVRLEQANALIVQMQSTTRAKIREFEARGKEEYEHAATYQMQAALADAAFALEKAKALARARSGAGR